MSRKIIPIFAASLLAAASMSGIAYAKGGGNGGGNGGGHGGGHGSGDHGGGNGHGGASGHGKHEGSAVAHGKSGSASGHLKSAEHSAKAHPEHVKQAGKHVEDEVADDKVADDEVADDEDDVASIDETDEADDLEVETAATGKLNFGRVISSIRAGKMDLTGVDETTAVNVVDVAGLIKGNNRVALENALADNQDEITTLHDDLTTLNLTGLQGEDVNDVVAVSRTDDGSLTVFVDHSE